MKPADGPEEGSEEPPEEEGPLPVSMEGEEIYQVRELLDSRRRGRYPVLGRLGGLRSGGEVLGQRR